MLPNGGIGGALYSSQSLSPHDDRSTLRVPLAADEKVLFRGNLNSFAHQWRGTMQRLLLATAMSVAFAIPTMAQTPPEDAHDVVEGWIAAFSAHDLAETVGYYLPEAIVWTTSGRALATGTEAFTTYFTNVFNSPLTSALGAYSTYVVSDDVVIEAGLIDVTNTTTGAITTVRFHFVLVDTDDGWKIAAHHSSRLPDPPATPAAAPATPAAAPAPPR